MSILRLATLALAATSIAASGCGGTAKSSGNTTAPTPSTSARQPTNTFSANAPSHRTRPLTRSQLIARAHAICKRAKAQQATIKLRSTASRDFARALAQLAAYEHRAAGELARLTPPASIANDWKVIVEANETLATDTGRFGEYAKANEVKVANGVILPEMGEARGRLIAAASRYGIDYNCTSF